MLQLYIESQSYEWVTDRMKERTERRFNKVYDNVFSIPIPIPIPRETVIKWLDNR